MLYKEYKAKRQQEFNELPIKFAFSNAQFKEIMEEWNLTAKDTDKIYKFPGGGFYRKCDAELIRAYFNKRDELEDLMKDYKFRVSAFRYEMDNHEYSINYYQGDWDVLNCFSDRELNYEDFKTYKEYLEEMNHPEWIESYKEAIKSHNKASENLF